MNIKHPSKWLVSGVFLAGLGTAIIPGMGFSAPFSHAHAGAVSKNFKNPGVAPGARYDGNGIGTAYGYAGYGYAGYGGVISQNTSGSNKTNQIETGNWPNDGHDCWVAPLNGPSHWAHC